MLKVPTRVRSALSAWARRNVRYDEQRRRQAAATQARAEAYARALRAADPIYQAIVIWAHELAASGALAGISGACIYEAPTIEVYVDASDAICVARHGPGGYGARFIAHSAAELTHLLYLDDATALHDDLTTGRVWETVLRHARR